MGKRATVSSAGSQLNLISPEHRFGGDWTEEKLKILEDYLNFYLTALKHQKFYLMYIDAFAGTGYRNQAAEATQESPSQQVLMFDREGKSVDEMKPAQNQSGAATEPMDRPSLQESLLHEDSERLLAGSVVRALRLEPGFRSYHFIEQDAEKVAHLRSLQAMFGKKQFVHHGDANDELLKLIKEIPWAGQFQIQTSAFCQKQCSFLTPMA